MYAPSLQSLAHAGNPTGGIFGALRTLRSYFDWQHFRKCIWVWDGGWSQRRLAIHPDYKKNRLLAEDATEEDKKKYQDFKTSFCWQRDALNQILNLLSVNVVRWLGREADDVVALATRILPEEIIVGSDDHDYLQLVSSKVSLYRQEDLVTEKFFESMVGMPQGWFKFYHAAIGDDGDGVPHIPGVGKGTVSKLIAEYIAKTGVEKYDPDIFDYAAQHKSKRIKAIGENRSIVVKNFDLIDLDKEVFDDYDHQRLMDAVNASRSFDAVMSKELLSQYGFKTLVSDKWLMPFQTLGF